MSHVLIGLGNPGRQYERTRHNAGFHLVDSLAEPATSWKTQGHSQVQKIALNGSPLLLAKPQTYMNLSGQAAQSLLAFYKVLPSALVVVVDDINLPMGSLRIRMQGGHGGHNGLRDIIARIGPDFIRIRVGVGPCPPGHDMAAFVLGRFAPDEWDRLQDLMPTFRSLIQSGLTEGWEKAGNRTNIKGPG